MNILIIGRNEVLYDTVRVLSKYHTICGIITAPASPEYFRKENDFENLAKELNCPFIVAKTITPSVMEFIRKSKAEIGVSVNWVSIISKEVLTLFSHGILNSHPSILPKYRGNAATNWAILMNEKEMGVTIHFMLPEELDSGDILCQVKMPVSDKTTIKELNDFWQKVTPDLLLKVIHEIQNGSSNPVKQGTTGTNGFRAYPRLPVDSKINWNHSAREIHAVVRASTHPYTGAYSYLKVDNVIKKLFIWETKIISESTKDIGTPGQIIYNNKVSGESYVYTGKGILSVVRAQFDGNKEFYPGKIWKSIRMRFGIDMEQEIINIQKKLNE